MSTYSVRGGDTLSALARKFDTSVAALAKSNHIHNVNHIEVGQRLSVPGGHEGKAAHAPKDGFDAKPGAHAAPAPSAHHAGAEVLTHAQAVAAHRGPVKDDDGRKFPTSKDGTPMYRQGDSEWGGRRLGRSSSIAAAGCAMTATAMALSKISGKVINPGELDHFMDKHGGYSGNGIIWGNAAKATGMGATKPGWSLHNINKQIDAGRPVVIGVDYHAGSNGGANGTDHWIAVTHRKGNTYYANDPATGKEIALKLEHGKLVGGPKHYRSTGELVTFTGGNKHPGTAPTDEHHETKPHKPASHSLKDVKLPSGDLDKGDHGAAVKELQHALVKAGHLSQKEMDTGPGTFGPKTESALKEFQHAHGVPATGHYGPLTRKAFEKLGAKVDEVHHPKPPTDSGGKGSVSLHDLQKIMPLLSDAKAKKYLPYLNAAMKEAHIDTPKRQAAFLAQLAHESGQFRWMEEIASGAAYEGRKDLGNTHPGDGKRFKGRGPIQLTGRSNYIAAGKALGLDLVHHPERAKDPDVGFRTAAWFWSTHGLNKLADHGNFREITHRINGGYNGMRAREAYYHKALQVLN